MIMKKLRGYPVSLTPCYADGENIMNKLKKNRYYKIIFDDRYHYKVGERVTINVRRNRFWERLCYIVFFGYVTKKKESIQQDTLFTLNHNQS